MLRLAEKLAETKKNLVCILKPVDYDLEGVIKLVKRTMPVSEHGFLMESLWKYLVYTQLALTYIEWMDNQTVYYSKSEAEHELLRFVESNSRFINPDFTIRLESVVSELCKVNFTTETQNNRAKISEILHSSVLPGLRKCLGNVLHNRRVCVLVDNLDKSWEVHSDLDTLSNFIFGLTSVSRVITDEFRKAGTSWQSANVSMMVFLRRDIFSYILKHAREADKFVYSTVDWSDNRLLQRIIEERFLNSIELQLPNEEIWVKFFTDKVRGVQAKDYLVSRIVPRPRDIIYFTKASLSQAINHGNDKIEENDILDAEKTYSYYAFLTLITETKPVIPWIEEFLIEFAGVSQIITKDGIEKILEKTNHSAEESEKIIPLLEISQFLGIEVDLNKFRFLNETHEADIVRSLARKVVERTGVERYQINAAFCSYLEIIE